MNKTVEAIMNGQKITMEEIFELVNCFNITSLNVQDGDNTVCNMQVNHFESYRDVFEFSQEHTNENYYVVRQSDILSVDAKWEKEIDCIIVMCRMANNMKMSLVIYYVSKEDFSISELDGYYEVDLGSVNEFLEDALREDGKYYCSLVRVSDKFSVFLKMVSPQQVFIDTLDDSDWKLHVSDWVSELNISVMDDSCNAFYRKDKGSSIEIVLKPYGQPFMEIKMLFSKRNK